MQHNNTETTTIFKDPRKTQSLTGTFSFSFMSSCCLVVECETNELHSGGGVTYLFKALYFRSWKSRMLRTSYASLQYQVSVCHICPLFLTQLTWFSKCQTKCTVCSLITRRITIFGKWVPCKVCMSVRQGSPDLTMNPAVIKVKVALTSPYPRYYTHQVQCIHLM